MNPLPSLSGATGAAPSTRTTRAAGGVLITVSALTVVLMLMHPTSGTHDPAEFVERAGRGIPGNAFVHGSMVSFVLILAGCFMWLRDLLGHQRPLVRAGMVAMVFGTAGAVSAGLINGFIVPSVAARFLGAGADEIDVLQPVLVLAREANATCARVSVLGLSFAAVAWSVCLLALPGWRRAAGAAGLLCGLIPLGLLAGSHLKINVEGYCVFVFFHSIWGVLAGLVLARHRPEP